METPSRPELAWGPTASHLGRMTMRSALVAILLALTGGCASGGGPAEPAWTNPPRCAGLAASGEIVPPDAVDSPPRPRTISLPPPPDGLDLGGEIDLEMVVTARGRVDPATVRTPGADRRVLRWARSFVEDWRFQPARREGCYVASPYLWSMSFGE